jgi:hypothetical protein
LLTVFPFTGVVFSWRPRDAFESRVPLFVGAGLAGDALRVEVEDLDGADFEATRGSSPFGIVSKAYRLD